ncbi:hypothetical protein IW262DRAFT_1453228 [Armillaria fumosa]|nr:hypothetical protein IW262DRAFT_1453228 [Armillaria fumosa]
MSHYILSALYAGKHSIVYGVIPDFIVHAPEIPSSCCLPIPSHPFHHPSNSSPRCRCSTECCTLSMIGPERNMPPKVYICQCRPGGHELLPGKEKIAHILELKAKQQSSLCPVSEHESVLRIPTTGSSAETDIEEPTLRLRGNTPEPTEELVARMAPLTLSDDAPDPSPPYADDLAARILTDGGPILIQQPSKLWSASSQLEDPEDPDTSQDAGGIPFSDVQSTLLNAVNEVHSSNTVSPLQRSSPPPTLANTSSRSSTNWRTQTLGRPVALASCRATTTPYVKAEKIIDRIDTNTGLLFQRMCTMLLTDLSPDKVTSSRKQLKEIALELKGLRESLARVQYGHEGAFTERKVAIVKVFHEIEAEKSLEPVLYTTDYIFDQHLDSLNAVAQLVTLLGIVCNCIVGLGRAMCNMIIAVSVLIVRLTMAANLTEDSDGDCDFDPNQEIIMDQLPSSLHTAQQVIKLDGRTTMYAVCPKCNACYEPIYITSLASKPSYPSRCEKRNPGPSELIVCGASLLKSEENGAKPIKPFLMASLEDFIARTLADRNVELLCDKACDDAMESLNNTPDPRRDTKNVFEADFMRQFKGPDGQTLFIDRKGKVHLAFALQMDFLNPNGT